MTKNDPQFFVNYYAILEIDERSTQEEIKLAFKRQALRWHPDQNPGVDTTERMQGINEAYLILKDTEARLMYDNEYQRFKQFNKQKYQKQHQQSDNKQSEQTYSYTEYQSSNDILNKWMNNAKKQAVNLAKQTIEDFKGMVSVGVKAAAKGALIQFFGQIIIGIIFVIIFALVKSCNN